eukprot:1057963-Prorocentrum_minimum.AAC.1
MADDAAHHCGAASQAIGVGGSEAATIASPAGRRDGRRGLRRAGSPGGCAPDGHHARGFGDGGNGKGP